MSDDALLHSPPAGHYGAGYGDLTEHLGMGGPVFHDEHHHHYQQFRRDHERQLDEDYAAWRRHRFGSEFEQWRGARQDPPAPRHESALQSLGRAISDTVTGTREPDLDELDDGGERRGRTERFFERS
jgi:hypothetical protein